MKKNQKRLSHNQSEQLIMILKLRFEKNMNRHKSLDWSKVEVKLKSNPGKLCTLNAMEETGGEPDVVDFDKKSDEYIFYDCSEESPKGRRSICYDQNALEARKENKPKNSAINMANEMGIEILNEAQYFKLQQLGEFDTKTSSWIETPNDIRILGVQSLATGDMAMYSSITMVLNLTMLPEDFVAHYESKVSIYIELHESWFVSLNNALKFRHLELIDRILFVNFRLFTNQNHI